MRKRRAGAGFTLIEVMVAVAIFGIGILGVVYMQGASVRSNQDAYESMVATTFARTWLDRIKRDSAYWTAPGAPAVATVFADRPGAQNSYFVPTGQPATPGAAGSGLRPMATESAGADYHGLDVYPGATDPWGTVLTDGDIYYCALAWFTGVQNNNSLLVAMRADVTVWWIRKVSLEATNYAGIATARQSGCDAANVVPALVNNPNVRTVSLATVVRVVEP